MIRPLRRQHRVMVVLLTVALITLFIAAFCARPDPPPPNQFRLPSSEKPR
jgi:hypothetical protein